MSKEDEIIEYIEKNPMDNARIIAANIGCSYTIAADTRRMYRKMVARLTGKIV